MSNSCELLAVKRPRYPTRVMPRVSIKLPSMDASPVSTNLGSLLSRVLPRDGAEPGSQDEIDGDG